MDCRPLFSVLLIKIENPLKMVKKKPYNQFELFGHLPHPFSFPSLFLRYACLIGGRRRVHVRCRTFFRICTPRFDHPALLHTPHVSDTAPEFLAPHLPRTALICIWYNARSPASWPPSLFPAPSPFIFPSTLPFRLVPSRCTPPRTFGDTNRLRGSPSSDRLRHELSLHHALQVHGRLLQA